MALPSSGEISILDIFRNRENSTTATPGANSDQDIAGFSGQFASGSTVGDVDGNGTGNQVADRDALKDAPHSFSEFYNADFPNSIFSSPVAQDSTGTSVMANGYVDGESNMRIAWRIDNGTTDDYTAGLKLATTNGIIVSATLDDNGNNKDVFVTIPDIPNRSAADDEYYPFVSTGTFTNAVGGDINHYDAIGSVTIAAPSVSTVTANTTAQTVTHTATVGDASSLSSYSWVFTRDGTVATDGTATPDAGGESGEENEASTAAPAVTYTGPGRYVMNVTVKGGKNQAGTTSTAVANRNSVAATATTFDVEYADSVTIVNPSDQNEGSVSVTGAHKGLAGGAKIGVVNSTTNTTFIDSDSTDTATSKFVDSDVTKTVTVTTTNTTIVAQARIEDKAASTTSANSSNFNIYPDVTTELAASDISVTVNPVIVGANTVLSVGNISDNITSYAWTLQTGTGTMTSTNQSGGGAGTATATIINEQTAATNTVSFNTAQASKTIRLTLRSRLNQTDTADKTISVELGDDVSINSISSINDGNSVTVSGTHAGLEHGVFFGLVASTDTDGFLETGTFTTATDSTDSRYATDSFTATVNPGNTLNTLTLQGRVEDRNSGGNAAGNITANTSNFNVFPTLNSTRNTINPNRTTIFSTSNNTDTSTYPTTVTFQTPGSETNNVTARQYTQGETGPSGHSFTTATSTTTNWGGGSQVGNKVITYAVTGTGATGTQTSSTTSTIAVNFMPRFTNATITGGTIIENVTDVIISVLNWQGSTVTALAAKVVATSTSTTAINSNGLVAISGTNFTGGLTDATANNAQGSAEWFPKGTSTLVGSFNLGTINADGTKVVKITSTSSPSISLDQNISVTGFSSVLLTKKSSGGWTTAEDAIQKTGGSFSNITKYYLGTFGNGTQLFDTQAQSSPFDGDDYFYNLGDTHVAQVANATGTVSNYFASANVPPKAPTSLSFTSVTTTAMTLNWTDNSAIEDGFKIYRNTGGAADSGDTLVSTTSANATSFTATSLTSSTTYYWAVYAFNGTSLSSVLQGSQATAAAVLSFGSISGGPSNLSTTGNVGASANDETGTAHQLSVSNTTGASVTLRGVFTGGSTPSAADGELSFGMSFSNNVSSFNNNTLTIVDGGSQTVYIKFELEQTKPDASSSGTAQWKLTNNGSTPQSNAISISWQFSAGGGDGDEGKCIDVTMMLNMKNGMMYVDSVSVGDMVRTYNMETQTDEYVEIEDIVRGPHYVYNVGLQDNAEILITDDHPIIGEDDDLLSIMPNKKLGSSKLKLGDKIKTTNGLRKVTSISDVGQDSDTYTIITKNKNFYADGILIHAGRID